MDKDFHNRSVSSKAGLITNDEELRIVMVGKTGIGKSASGNMILGQKAFVSKFCAESMTVDCKKEKGLVGGQKVAVIDTPGLFDTRYDKEKTTKDLSQCISFAAPGPHVFLVIIRLGRFTDEEKKTVEKIQEVFGQAANRYSMVLFTGGDLLEGTIEEFLDECSDLQELVCRCNNQYHVFNNKIKDGHAQVDELLQKIRNIVMKNGGSHYTNDDFQEAERAVEEEKQRILKEREEEMRRQEEEMERKVGGKYEKKMKTIQEEMQLQREQDREESRRELKKLQEQHEREVMMERQKMRAKCEAQARKQAEESNPWNKFGQLFKEAFTELGKGIVYAFTGK